MLDSTFCHVSMLFDGAIRPRFVSWSTARVIVHACARFKAKQTRKEVLGRSLRRCDATFRPPSSPFAAPSGRALQLGTTPPGGAPHEAVRAARACRWRVAVPRRSAFRRRRASTARARGVPRHARTPQRHSCRRAAAGGARARRRALLSVRTRHSAALRQRRADAHPARSLVRSQSVASPDGGVAAATEAAGLHAFWKFRGVRLEGERRSLVERGASGGLFGDTHGALVRSLFGRAKRADARRGFAFPILALAGRLQLLSELLPLVNAAELAWREPDVLLPPRPGEAAAAGLARLRHLFPAADVSAMLKAQPGVLLLDLSKGAHALRSAAGRGAASDDERCAAVCAHVSTTAGLHELLAAQHAADDAAERKG